MRALTTMTPDWLLHLVQGFEGLLGLGAQKTKDTSRLS